MDPTQPPHLKGGEIVDACMRARIGGLLPEGRGSYGCLRERPAVVHNIPVLEEKVCSNQFSSFARIKHYSYRVSIDKICFIMKTGIF